MEKQYIKGVKRIVLVKMRISKTKSKNCLKLGKKRITFKQNSKTI